MMFSTAENVQVLIDAWKLMVKRLPAGTFEQSEGIAATFGHVPLPFLNVSIQDAPAPDEAKFRALLASAQAKASNCAEPSLLALTEPWLPGGWEAMAAEAGLAPMMTMTGMVAEELLPPRRPPAELEMRRVSDNATATDLATINAHAYGMPPAMFECICNLHLWHADSYAYVGYAEGRAVSTAAALPLRGSVYIALVATMPDVHGKGYADAVMRHAISEGRRGIGIERTTLHATEMGQPVYRAMGFVPGDRIVLLGPAGH